MKYSSAPFVFVLGAAAHVIRNDQQQCFQINASGGASGTLGQLGDGQNRIGGGMGPACYCLNSGGFTDTSGRGCILTPPTTQFQCDTGASPTTGFAVNNGDITYNGDNTFYACPATTNGEYNIYTTPVKNQPKCVKVTLMQGSACGGSAPKPQTSMVQSTMPMSQTTVTQTVTNERTTTVTVTNENTVQPTCPAPATVTNEKTVVPTCPPAATVTVTNENTVHPTCPAPATVTNENTVAPTCPPAATVTVTNEKPYPTNVPSTMMTSEMAPPQPAPTTSEAAPPKPAPTTSEAAPPKPAPTTSEAAPPKPAPTMSEAAPPKPASSCPADLGSDYQYPHLMVPVSSSHPDKSSGTSYNGVADGSSCTLYNFDIPGSYSGKTCTAMFMLPEKSQLETSSYTMSGSGSLDFSMCDSAAKEGNSWNSSPKCSSMGSCNAMPGNAYTVGTGACAAGQTVTYKMCATGGLSMEYFQDYNPCPIGMYVIPS